jgi:hypothetical protein
LGVLLRERQRCLLVGLLAVLHLAMISATPGAVSLMCWLVDVGLFMLWQPFVRAERKLDAQSLSVLVLALAAGIWLYGWWLLILWCVVLAALIGGRVLLLDHLPTRLFYLLAFAYLLCALLVRLVPRIVPDAALLGPSLDEPFAWSAPLIFAVMLLLPRPRELRLPTSGMVDFFYGLFIFLLISVLVLGSLAFMLLRQSFYIEAVLRTLVTMALILLLLAWAWNPRPGFAGIGVFFSRYLLTIGLPFETWLQRLMECAEHEADADRFMFAASQSMLDLPWVVGGRWAPVDGAHAGSGQFGEQSGFAQTFVQRPLQLTLYTRHPLSPSLVWHFHLLAQLSNEYYIAKQHASQLQQISYLRAVHETGARLTHDVKNLLQSLDNLCFLAQAPGELDARRLTELILRQLPQISQRLQRTLEKLQAPQSAESARSTQAANAANVSAAAWWESLQRRHAYDDIDFCEVVCDSRASVPAALFDSVVDNLLNNAMLKRQNERGLAIRVELAADASSLRVHDDGSAVNARIAPQVLHAPVPSENGLGIGLYHAACQAQACGWELRLLNAAAGDVCFELRRADAR